MIKIFETGDLHIGKKFDRFPEVKDKLISSRFECLKKMVREAERQGCSVFVITGDTFDNTASLSQSDVDKVVNILSEFSGKVLVLPGNHDYYNEETKIWKQFRSAMEKTDGNITVMNEFAPVTVEIGAEKAVFYPAYCQSKHSTQNNIGWIKECRMDPSSYNIGVAHGAISGLTPDVNGEYFLMTLRELETVPVDVWLIGHTHIQYPAAETGKELKGHRVYNAGTPEQLDLHNNTEGTAFVITLDKASAAVTAEAVKTGIVSYKDMEITMKPGDKSLESVLKGVCKVLDNMTVVRLKIKGAVEREDFENREAMYLEMLSKALTYEVEDEDLSPIITMDQVKAEFPEYGFAAAVLGELSVDPTEMQMAYELLKECTV